MAVDSAQKRFSATMLLMPGFTPGVVPEDATIDATLRLAVTWMYAGIAAGAVAISEMIGGYRLDMSLGLGL